MKTTLLIDVSALACRSFYTTGVLAYRGQHTGILYGLFRDILKLRRDYPGARMVFCFDRGCDARKVIYPKYKAKRYEDLEDAAVAESREMMRSQLNDLRNSYLSVIGFRNSLSQNGYEADDVIASICHEYAGRIIIVSPDNDLLQLLLGSRITLLNPRGWQVTDWDTFRRQWGIKPSDWAKVKAIAGCTSDGVEGIKGVGEITAAKYLRNELRKTTKAYHAIVSDAGQEVIYRNLELVRLPFQGTKQFELHDDEFNLQGWDMVMRGLGIQSLQGEN